MQLFSIPVADQSRSRDFYVDTLGFELVADSAMGPDQRWVQVRPSGAETAITLVTWFDSMTPGSYKGTVIESDDLDSDVEQDRERGVAIGGEIQQAPSGGSSPSTTPTAMASSRRRLRTPHLIEPARDT